MKMSKQRDGEVLAVVDYSRVMLCDSCFDRCPDKKENNCDHGKDGGRCDVCGEIDHNRMHCLGYCAPSAKVL
jgi:hypothetical protein